MIDRDEAADRGALRLLQGVLAERCGDVRALERRELVRERPGLEDEREVLRLAERADAGDLGVAADAVRERAVRVVDLRPRFDLAVEHDREVLRRLLQSAALVETLGDPLELLAPGSREVHEDDGALARVEVGARSGEHQIGARQLRNRLCLVLRVVLEEVPAGRRRRPRAARADARVGSARDDHGSLGHAEDGVFLLLAGGRVDRRDVALLRRLRVVERVLRDRRPGDQLLGLLVEEVPLARALVLDEALLAGEQRVDVRLRIRVAGDRLRRAGEIGFEVVELELGGLADQCRGCARVVDAGELDDDLVGALLANLGLRDAELVDAVPHDVLRDRHPRRVDILVLRRNRLEDDFEAALEIEPLLRRLVPRGAGDGHVERRRRRRRG